MSLIHPLTQSEINRYMRQISLDQIGIEGQKKLKNARVLCVGAGGLGSPLLLYLAAAGVGTLGIIDDDSVEISNLPRQILFQDQHIGYSKAEIMKQKLLATNPHIKINYYHERLIASNKDIIKQYDIVADCTDNFTTRYFVNDVCFEFGMPYVFASVQQFVGQCSIFLGAEGPCYRCLFPSPPPREAIPDCNRGGILGVLPGIFGLIQAAEIIKWIVRAGESLCGRLLTLDMLKMQFNEFVLSKNPDCEICGKYRMIKPIQKLLESKTNMNEHIISPRELSESLKNQEDIQLVDVRTIEKHEAFNIGGKLIPLDELMHRFNELDPKKPVVTYCTSGGKSMLALKLLLSAGFKSVKSLDGGMTAWREQKLSR